MLFRSKTVGLLCMMASSGLHVPAKTANIPMFSQVLCDIGDGQNVQDNLSTFSSHIKSVHSMSLADGTLTKVSSKVLYYNAVVARNASILQVQVIY